ncbi:hypothetical protein FNV43_RR23408 [Rhamnella rubrinervis]|uniref:MADS-box domain-containing protein n=1 Tax=Rhamnella rubrinervis TaxID=2594499 RepID=A0A8K0GSY3_9ROSA|nr:hypothetical protein FNV43_RR23408 [Rhamnella rubrinervis]
MNAMENSSLPPRDGDGRKAVELLNPCSKNIYKARKNTLKRKAGELATLCNVEVCMICYGSDGDLELWPEDSEKAKFIVTKYNEVARKGNPKGKEDLNFSDLPRNSSTKKMKLDHYDNKNSNNGVVIWDEQLGKLSKECLVGLSNYLEAKIQILGDKIDQFFKNKANEEEEEEKLLVGQISTDFCDHHELPSWSDIFSMIAFAETHKYDMIDNLSGQPSHFSPGVPVDYSDDAAAVVPSESTIITNNINEVAWPFDTYYPEIGTSCCATSTSNANGSVASSDDYWSQLLGANYVKADEDFTTESFLMYENYGTTTGFDNFFLDNSHYESSGLV